MAFFSALPSGGVCAVFTDAQLAKTNAATSNIIVTWFFMAFLNVKLRGGSQSFGAAHTDRNPTISNKNSAGYEHQKLRVIGQVVDERLAVWSAIDRSVTKNFF